MHNYFQFYISDRAEQTMQWCVSDNIENYKKFNEFGENLYSPESFSYTFNSHGFRCDEFNIDTELPILFLGCSSTEGIGLPLEEVWTYKLLTKIRNATGKKIPFWNLALGGSGIDTQARILYEFSRVRNFKYVFAYFPPIYRREFCYKSSLIKLWGPLFGHVDDLNKLFEDRDYALHQTYRSLITIDAVLRLHNAKMHSSAWGQFDLEDNEFILNNFPNLNYFTFLGRKKDMARDSIHFGPSYHTELAEAFWEKCKHDF